MHNIMDLDGCSLHNVVDLFPSIFIELYVVDQSYHPRLVNDRDSIRWHNIDGP